MHNNNRNRSDDLFGSCCVSLGHYIVYTKLFQDAEPGLRHHIHMQMGCWWCCFDCVCFQFLLLLSKKYKLNKLCAQEKSIQLEQTRNMYVFMYMFDANHLALCTIGIDQRCDRKIRRFIWKSCFVIRKEKQSRHFIYKQMVYLLWQQTVKRLEINA